MIGPWLLLLLVGYLPWLLAWRGARGTTLRPALGWGLAAWTCWCLAALTLLSAPSWGVLARYLALCVTGAAGVAVLGARRPGVEAWHFVVLGLLAGLLLPVAQGLGTPRLHGPALAFLGGVLVVGTLNYLPTRHGLTALAVGAGCAAELASLAGADLGPAPLPAGRLLFAAAPWLGLPQARGANPADARWLAFRDRHGAVWALRMRDLFDRAAENASLPAYLSWGGLRPTGSHAVPVDRADELLLSLLRRFESHPPERAA